MPEKSRSATTEGYLFAILGATIGGSIPTLSKVLLAHNTPVVLAGFSLLISGLPLLLYQPRVLPSRRGLPYLLFMGVVGAALAQIMFNTGLRETTALNASLLSNGEVLFTTIIALTIFGERLSRRQAIRGLPIVVGLITVSTNLDLTHVAFLQGLVGNLLVLGAIVLWSFENNLIALATKQHNTSYLSKFRNLIGGVGVTAIIFVFQYPFGFTTFDLVALLLLGGAISAATFLFIAAVKRLGAIRMLLVWSTATLFGAIYALVFLGEQLTVVQVLGGLLILSGIYLFHRGEAIPEAEPFTPPAGPASK